MKKVDYDTIETKALTWGDYPDCPDFVQYAEYEDGTPLTEKELDEFQAEYAEYCWELYCDSFYGG